MHRKTLNFEAPVTWARAYAQPGTLEHVALQRVIGEPAYGLTSESAVLVSLVEYAHKLVEEEKLRLLYDDAYGESAMERAAEAAMNILERDYVGFTQGNG
jgi:hypothetical protein